MIDTDIFASVPVPYDREATIKSFATLQTWVPRLRALREEVTALEAIILGTGQIQFPATQLPSTGANVLDDYEEGTWTPTDASGGGLTFTYPDINTYVKVGQLVLIQFRLTYPATADVNIATIGGLPFTVNGSYYSGVCLTDAAVPLYIQANASTTQFYIAANGPVVVKTNVQLTGANVYGSFTYRASA